MAKNTKKALELRDFVEPVVPAPVAQEVPTENVVVEKPVYVGKRIPRGHKYDNKTIDLSKLTQTVMLGAVNPNPPRGQGRPSVMFRIHALVGSNPGITVGALIEMIIDRSEEFKSHPSPYTHKDRLEAMWVRDYLKGMVTRGFLIIE